jgi:hypothetical protein
VVFLLERDLISWSLAMDEHGRHKDLCDSSHRSVIPYVHRRTELYCSSLYEPEPFLFSAHLKWRLPEPFITQGQVVYNEPQGPTGGPGVGKLYAIGHND